MQRKLKIFLRICQTVLIKFSRCYDAEFQYKIKILLTIL